MTIYRLDNAGLSWERRNEDSERPHGRPQLHKRVENFLHSLYFD